MSDQSNKDPRHGNNQQSGQPGKTQHGNTQDDQKSKQSQQDTQHKGSQQGKTMTSEKSNPEKSTSAEKEPMHEPEKEPGKVGDDPEQEKRKIPNMKK
jgi:hypothetical protein